ncbi:hypothetical protein CEXT_327091 [Caerostris extrusa]|uniref:Uncharacterized protein n=1 Tax=Caerostris extrusa TaxID=172846 RepID=A0AAV4RUL0_CAEEX|nr:hypothetical protein CEXT_327091 [Caerostris extrusa]
MHFRLHRIVIYDSFEDFQQQSRFDESGERGGLETVNHAQFNDVGKTYSKVYELKVQMVSCPIMLEPHL